MPATLPSPSHRSTTFDGLSDDIVTYCLEHAALATARRGELLIQQGEPARLVVGLRVGHACSPAICSSFSRWLLR